MRWLLLVACSLALARAASADNPVVRFDTPLGSFEVELCREASALCLGAAPSTVANFLTYLDDGDYAGSFVHRSVPGFVIQGGSFVFVSGLTVDPVPPDPPIANEFNQSNLRGTVAAPLSGIPPNPDSATSGWFINLADNAGLDADLFTVFGVVRPPGMTAVDAIAQEERWNFGGAFTTLPLIDYPGTGGLDGHVVTTDVTRVPEPGAQAAGCALGALAALAWLRRRHAPRASSALPNRALPALDPRTPDGDTPPARGSTRTRAGG